MKTINMKTNTEYRLTNMEMALDILKEAIRIEKLKQQHADLSIESRQEISNHHQRRIIDVLNDNL